jgi:hypothetical protein
MGFSSRILNFQSASQSDGLQIPQSDPLSHEQANSKDDPPSSDSDVIILDNKNQPAYTVRTSRKTAVVMPTVLEEGENMGLAEAPGADYLDALARDGGVSRYLFFSSFEDLTLSCYSHFQCRCRCNYYFGNSLTKLSTNLARQCHRDAWRQGPIQ